jgi:hypothetical protein
MSGSRPTVGIRISTEGADRARQQIEQYGTAGEAAMRRVQGATNATRPAFQALAGASDAARNSLAGMSSSLGLVTSGFSGAAAAGSAMGVAIVGGLTASIRAAEQFERLGLRTEAVIKATGGAAGLSAQQIREMSQELARGTLASTAGVEAAAQKLLTFRSIAGDTFGRTLRAAQDLAAVGFGSIDSAAVQLGKALESPIQGVSALAEVGVSFSQSQRDVIKSLVETGQAAEAQRLILAGVEQQVGGAGGAEAGGLAGAYDTLSQNAEEFLLAIGNVGPIHLAKRAIEELAAVMGGLARMVTPDTAIQVAESAVRSAQTGLSRVQAQNQAQRNANAYGDLPPGAQAAERVAYDELTVALARLQELRDEAARTQAARQAQADAVRVAAEREAAAASVRTLEQSLDRKLKIQEEHRQRMAVIDAGERTGALTPDRAAALRIESTRRETEELEKLARAQEGVAVATRGRADAAKEAERAEREASKATEAAAKAAQKAQEDATRAAERYQQRSFDAVANIGERAMDRVGDAIVDAFTRGEGAAINFGSIARGIATSVVADFARLAVINPLLNSVFTSSAGPRPTLAGAFGGGATSFGGFGGLAGLLPAGITGLGATQLINPGGGYISPIGEAGAPIGGLTLGGLAGSAFGGMGVGSLLAGLTGGNTLGGGLGGAIGGGGAAALAAIPAIAGMLGPLAPFAPLIGGLLGGGLGGLIGPPPSSRGFSYALRGDGEGLGAGVGSQLQITDRFFNQEGAAQFAQADAAIVAINDFLASRGLTVQGARAVGGNRDGMGTLGLGEASSFGEALGSLSFGANDNERLSSYLGGQSFTDPAKLQQAVDGFLAAQAAIEALGAEAVPQFTAQLDAINKAFDDASETAKKYGLEETNLTAARVKQIADLEAARAETLRQSGVALSIRRLAAGGNTQEAELTRQAEAARLELEAFGRSLDALAIAAEDRAARLIELEEVQAAERAAIISRYGEQAAAALRQAGGNIRQYLDGLQTGTSAGASPYDRLVASQATFKRDQTLASGGDQDALARITSSADAALSAARDYFASGAGFEFVKNQVVGGLTDLPVVQSYDAQMTASLAAIQAALDGGAATVGINPAANTVALAGLSLGALETIGRTQINLLSAIRSEAFTIGGVAHAIAAGTTAALYEIGGVAHRIAADAHQTLVGVHQTAATGNQFLAVIASIGQAANDHQVVANRIAADASAATVTALSAVQQASATGASVLLGGINAGNTIAADANGSLLAAIGVSSQIAVDASAAQVQAESVGHQIAATAATATVAAINAGNTIAADSAGAIVTALNYGNTLSAFVAQNDNGGALASRLADINTSLGTVDASVRDVNTSLATVDARVAAAGSASVLAQNAGNQIAVDVGAAATQTGAIGNSHLAALLAATQAGTAHGLVTAGQIQVVANRAHSAVLHIATHQQYTLQGNARIVDVNTSVGKVNASARDINTSLGTVDASVRDVNASLSTVDARVAAAGSASVLAQNAGNQIAVDVGAAATQTGAIGNSHLAALLAATQAGTAHGLVTAGQIQVVANRAHSAVLHIATHQQYTLQGNARIVDVNTSVGRVNASARDINTSLGTVDASVRDVNTSLSTVNGSVAAVMFAQNAGNTIAADASAASVSAATFGHQIATDASAAQVDMLGRVEALTSANNGALAAVALHAETIAIETALNGGRLVEGFLGLAQRASESIQYFEAGNNYASAANDYHSSTNDYLRATNDWLAGLVTEIRALRAEVAALQAANREGLALTATETRTLRLANTAELQQANSTLRRLEEAA